MTAMGTAYAPRSFTDPVTNEDHTSTLHIGWTTDERKANAARDLGATITRYMAHDPAASGWEISVRVIA